MANDPKDLTPIDPPPEGLNERQKRFCAEYLKDFNATASAIRAGYSVKTAASIGSENLQKPEIARYLAEQAERLGQKVLSTAEGVMRETHRLANSDIRALMDEAGNLIGNPKDLPDDVAMCISSIEIVEEPRREPDGSIRIDRVRKVRFWDKNAALALLAKLHKLASDAPNVVNNNLVVNVSEIGKMGPDELAEVAAKNAGRMADLARRLAGGKSDV